MPLATGKSRGRGGARGQEGDRVELSLCSIDGGRREASRNEYEVIFHVFSFTLSSNNQRSIL